jgi:hypothetical protein
MGGRQSRDADAGKWWRGGGLFGTLMMLAGWMGTDYQGQRCSGAWHGVEVAVEMEVKEMTASGRANATI